jgi:thiol-disulfide isomerase/thioredoxin
MTEAIKAKTPPQAAQMGMDFDKVRCLWGKDGLIRKQEMLARDGTPSMMMEMTNYTFGVELDDALFSFTPPEGVPVQDMTLQYETALQSDEKLDPEKLKALEELVKNFVTSSADTSTDAETPQGKYKVGDTAPDFTGPGLKGDKVSLAQFRGKVTLLDFWATWCGPCVHELPNVIAAYKKYHDEGFDILSVSLDDERPALDKFLGEHADMKWGQIYEGKGWDSEIGKMFGVEAIPFTLLLDAEGKIIGADLRGEALDAAIAKALAK